jgi:hypothetical protein
MEGVPPLGYFSTYPHLCEDHADQYTREVEHDERPVIIVETSDCEWCEYLLPEDEALPETTLAAGAGGAPTSSRRLGRADLAP